MIPLWYALCAIGLAVYVALDGFDLGAGIVAPLVTRTQSERGEVLAAIGPFWDGNEVWLIASGGTLLMVFPAAFAAGFSGLYLPLTIFLWLLILRGISMELRSHLDNPLWRGFWDWLLVAASLLLVVILGAALGIVLRGVPLDRSGAFFLPLFGGPGGGVLDLYTVLVGVVAVGLLAHHGAQFLAWRAKGVVQQRSRSLTKVLLPIALVLMAAAAVATALVQPPIWSALLERPVAWLPVGLAFAGIALCATGTWTGRAALAFAGSAVTLVSVLGASAAAEFPILLRSTLGSQFNIEAAAAASGPNSLSAAAIWWPIGLVLAAAYSTMLFRVFRNAHA